ncbi:MAG TPA: cysteine--tRNA ligase [Candidatus Bathyarchaeia archaeon]|nr:cysteine--tRNA ligase [Candidatus Bathyarchaeia archaeon]
MKFYNSLTRKIEEFKPINPSKVGMYVCGITAYDHTHLGHMRAFVNADLLRRVLESNGFKVVQVENVTDVGHLFGDRDMGEDKLEATAKKVKKSAWEIAKEYEKEFFETMAKLNVRRPTVVCRATAHIKEMIDLIGKLEKKGFTYKTSDGVYFNTAKIKDYNRLSGMNLEKLKEGARVEVNPEKENPTDFALWKFSPKGVARQMEWDSPWGVGFPGWHIECSAMGMKYLGKKIDIHTGGEDHISVHHTNERAQNMAAVGREVVNYWFHSVFLLVEGEKMSKSLKNFYWLKDVCDRGFDPLALRYLFLTAHYRTQLNFTWKGLTSAQIAYRKLIGLVREWRQEGKSPASKKGLEKIDHFRQEFQEKINHDLNLPEALAVVWQMAKSNLSSSAKLGLILDFDQVLGLGLGEVKEIKLPEKVRKLLDKREKLRQASKWQEADKIRQQITKLGYKIEDSSKGVKANPV